MIASDRLITLAIHTYDRAVKLKQILEHYGIETVIHNVNLVRQSFASAVRVRICEKDLSRALQIIEGKSLDELFLTISEMTQERKDKIIIPVDFSPYSIKECMIGFTLAERFNAEVIIVHSFMGSAHEGGLLYRGNSYKMLEFITSKVDSDVKCDAVERMNELVDNLNSMIASGELPSVNFNFEISQGVPEMVIRDAAKRLNPILIVMGSGGANRKGGADLLGSVTAEVLDAAEYAVLTVPEGVGVERLSSINNVVLFTDLKEKDLYRLEPFIRQFNGEELEVKIVGIADDDNGEEGKCKIESLTEFCQTTYPDFKFSNLLFNRYHYLEALDNYLRANSVDIIIIPNKKRNILSRLRSASMAQRVLFNSDTPIMAVPY